MWISRDPAFFLVKERNTKQTIIKSETMKNPKLLLSITIFLPLLTVSAAGNFTSYCNAIVPSHSLHPDQLTVLISGYSTHRLPLLRNLAVFYSSLPIVSSVLILWGNPSTPKSHLNFPSTPTPITVLRNPTSSLNLRFLPRSQIKTLAVAICDDDVEIDANSISFAFKTWQSDQDRIVGFFPRSHDLDLDRKTWIYTVHPHKYSIMLTKFMIIRSDYLRTYTCAERIGMADARRVVERERNCEDLLMNLVVAMETGKGPVVVEGKRVRDWGDTRNDRTGKKIKVAEEMDIPAALSGIEGHRRRRGECIREFHRVLGTMSLRYSYGKVVEGVKEQGLCRKGGRLVACDRER